MDTQSLLAAVIVLTVLVAALALAVWRLRRAIAGVRQESRWLSRALERHGNDMAGLSSAGVQMDRLLIEHEKRLRECLDRFDSMRAEPAPGGVAYHGPIERIRKGASAEDLVSEFGISLSEAKLLVRLHGSAQ